MLALLVLVFAEIQVFVIKPGKADSIELPFGVGVFAVEFFSLMRFSRIRFVASAGTRLEGQARNGEFPMTVNGASLAGTTLPLRSVSVQAR
jgi:hypothetical protein